MEGRDRGCDDGWQRRRTEGPAQHPPMDVRAGGVGEVDGKGVCQNPKLEAVKNQ